jgi:monovalent cation:proton antiporter-2 (CPA2) family protein
VENLEFILALVLILFTTKIAGTLAVRLGQPAVLGKLISGVLLGPAVLGWIMPSDFIHYFSQIGVLLLMFIAGLETDLEQFRQSWKSSLAVAVGGVIFPMIGGYSLGMALGWSTEQALFLALVISATSVSISVQTLKEMNKLNSKEGTTILGAAVVDDILVVVLLAVTMSFFGAGEAVSIPSLLLKKVLFFAVIIAAGWFIVPHIMKWMSKFKVTETVVSAAIFICLGFSYFAELMGVAGIIGAFAAGIAISQTSFKHTVETKIEPIAYTLFVPVFFVSIGLDISFAGLGEQIWFIVILTLICIFTKLVGSGLGARLTGFNLRQSMAIGSGMISRGEVALILMTSSTGSHLLTGSTYTSIVLVVIITTLVTPPLLKKTLQGSSNQSKPIESSSRSV